MENELKKDRYLSLFNEYLKTLSVYFEETPVDIKSPDLLLRQIVELAKSIKALLKKEYIWQSEILKRTLKESVVLTFVICSLKKEAQKAYLALYELQGWHEVLEIFEKLDFDKHKKGDWPGVIRKRMKELERVILAGFKSFKNEKVSEKKLKFFIRTKLSRYIYKDAKIIAEQKYKDFPEIQKAVSKLLKGGGLYQAESNFVHARYFSAVLMAMKDKKSLVINKKTIVRDTISGIHLAMSVYAIDKDSMTPLLNRLTRIARKIPRVFD